MNQTQTILGLPLLQKTQFKTSAMFEVVQDNANQRLSLGDLKAWLFQCPKDGQLFGIKDGVFIPMTTVEEAPNDGQPYVRRGTRWEVAAVSNPINPTKQYLRQGGTWKEFDRYDLPMRDPTDGGFDLARAQVFKLDGTQDYEVAFKNLPPEGRTMLVTLMIKGSGGVITWPESISWDQNQAPIIGDNLTIITFVWCAGVWAGSTHHRA